MSLFDELLTKSQISDSPNASESTGQQQDPLSGSSIVINESAPISTTVMDGVVMVPIESPVVISPEPIKKIPVSDDALIISNDTEPTTSDIPESPIEPKEPVQATNSLFGMMNSSQDEVVSSKKTPETSFRDTNEYIEHAIDEVSELISSLDAADQSKLAEESEYEHQKEHFAELEVQAEAEHQKILAEKAHAEEMKKYLESERAEKEGTIDEAPEEEQNEEITSSEQVSSEEVSSDEEDAPEENISPKKKDWTWFGKKNNKPEEEESREVFI